MHHVHVCRHVRGLNRRWTACLHPSRFTCDPHPHPSLHPPLPQPHPHHSPLTLSPTTHISPVTLTRHSHPHPHSSLLTPHSTLLTPHSSLLTSHPHPWLESQVGRMRLLRTQMAHVVACNGRQVCMCMCVCLWRVTYALHVAVGRCAISRA